MADNPRIDDLRRRVQKDPASIAFAQLAEEFRRAGQHKEAVEVCLSGLAIHPTYLSARVTLGRALLELGHLVDARVALETVLRSAPENLAALRGLAEVHHKSGELAEALAQYKAALALARNDPDLEETVADLTRKVSPRPRMDAADGLSFDQITRELSAHAPAPVVGFGPEAPEVRHVADMAADSPEPPLQSAEAPVDPAREHARHAVTALEGWLAAIHVTRADRHA